MNSTGKGDNHNWKWLRQFEPDCTKCWRANRRVRKQNPTLYLHPKASVYDCKFGRFNSVDHHAWLVGCNLGDRTYVADSGSVGFSTIGKFCSLGNRCFIGLPQHPTAVFVSTHPIFYMHNPRINADYTNKTFFDSWPRTTIGNDVWIGAGAQVKSGLKVSDGAIIAAGAIVTRDVAPYAIVAGVPARVIRHRFDKPGIDFLLSLRWWDRPDDWLRLNFEKFHDIKRLQMTTEVNLGANGE